MEIKQKKLKKLVQHAKNTVKEGFPAETFFRCIHFAYILRKNKVISTGINIKRTDGKAIVMGYPYGYLHAEARSIKRLLKNRGVDPKDCQLINIRLSRASGDLLMAAPCQRCIRLIQDVGIKNVYFSLESGRFGKIQI